MQLASLLAAPLNTPANKFWQAVASSCRTRAAQAQPLPPVVTRFIATASADIKHALAAAHPMLRHRSDDSDEEKSDLQQDVLQIPDCLQDESAQALYYDLASERCMLVAPDETDPDGATLAMEGAASAVSILDEIDAIKVHLTADCTAQAAVLRAIKRLISFGRRDGAHGRGIVCTDITVSASEDSTYDDPPEVNKAMLAAVVNSAAPDLQRLAFYDMDVLTQAASPLAKALRRLSGLQELVIARSNANFYGCGANHAVRALVPALSSCSALTNLTFEEAALDPSVSTALLSAVGKLHRLRKLQLPQLNGGHHGIRQLASLAALTSLTCIDVQQAFGVGGRLQLKRNMEDFLLQLPRLRNMQSLAIGNAFHEAAPVISALCGPDAAHLRIQLKHLEFSWGSKLPNAPAAALESLQLLKGLTFLRLVHSPVHYLKQADSTALAAALTELPQLQALWLECFSDPGFGTVAAAVAQMPGLTELCFRNAHLKQDTIDLVAAAPTLRKLRLNACCLPGGAKPPMLWAFEQV